MEEAETSESAKEERPVLDIHPPHEAAHSWRDILIHLATITVGLFIALSLEGCVEWQHHRHLVREARENIRSEIEDNEKDLRSALDDIHRQQTMVKRDIESLAAMRKNPKSTGHSVTLTFRFTSMQNASWSTARETGAFAYMSYPDVKKYAELYDLQALYASETSRVQNAYSNSFSVLSSFDVDKAESNEIQRSDIDSALQKVMTVQSELMIYESVATALEKQYKDVLQHS